MFSNLRIGHGYDVHRLVEGRRCIIGGVDIPYERGLLGHSDADVLAHALADAILGACRGGDIGKLFPDTDPAYEGADSMVLLARVMDYARELGFEFVDADRRHSFIRGIAEINAGLSVTVNVDEPGNSHFAVDINHFIRLRKRISFGEDLSDHVIFNKDGGAVQLHIRRDEVTVFEKHVH